MGVWYNKFLNYSIAYVRVFFNMYILASLQWKKSPCKNIQKEKWSQASQYHCLERGKGHFVLKTLNS